MSTEEGVFNPAAPIHWIHDKGRFPRAAPYKCGAMGVQASSNRDDVNCADCLALMRSSVTCPACLDLINYQPQEPALTTRHVPPYMNDADDGVFRFHGAHSDLGGEMEVIPMTTGNVEFEVRDTVSGKGMIFNLHHLDRADLIRALLHDFHYSPERGGPADD